MRTQRFAVSEAQLCWVRRLKLVPIDQGLLEILNTPNHHVLRRQLEVLVKVRRLGASRRNQQTRRELITSQHRYERRCVLPRQRSRRRIKLALNCNQIASTALAGHQIDTGVSMAFRSARPLLPRPHLVESLRPDRVDLQERLTEILKPLTLRSLRLRGLLEKLQQLTKRGHVRVHF